MIGNPSFDDQLRASPVIPAVRSIDHLEAACGAPAALVYLLTGDVATIGELLRRLREHGKRACVNIDLLGGLSGDASSVEYLARLGAYGIISTHTQVLKAANARKLLAIQRSFMLDSQALANTLRSLERFIPDAVEVLPAVVAPRIASRLRAARTDMPVIAGGLVADLAEIDRLIRSGIDAVSVGDPALWIV